MGQIEHELRIVAQGVGRGDVVIDVGANVGLYAFAVARLGPFVHAFEPVGTCRKVLEAYGHPRICIHPEALSDQPGQMFMRIPVRRGNVESPLATLVHDADRADSSGSTFESVQVRTLDSYGFERADLVKIDVEGHEQQVIRGAQDLISRTKPVMLIEIEQRRLDRASVYDVIGLVESLGYIGYFFAQKRQRSVREFNVQQHQLQWVGDVERTGFSHEYVNNFLFVPADDRRAF